MFTLTDPETLARHNTQVAEAFEKSMTWQDRQWQDLHSAPQVERRTLILSTDGSVVKGTDMGVTADASKDIRPQSAKTVESIETPSDGDLKHCLTSNNLQDQLLWLYWSADDTNNEAKLGNQELWLGNWILVIAKCAQDGDSATLKKCSITYLVTDSKEKSGLWGPELQGVDLSTIDNMVRSKKIVRPIAPVVSKRGSTTSLPMRSTWDLQDACPTWPATMDPAEGRGCPLRLNIRETDDAPVCVVNVFLPPSKYHDLPTYLVKQITPAAHERHAMPLRKRERMDAHLHQCGLNAEYLPTAIALQNEADVVIKRGEQWVNRTVL